MGNTYIEKKEFLAQVPNFVGLTFAEVAKKNSLISQESLLSRFHKYNIDFETDGPTFEGKIISIKLPHETIETTPINLEKNLNNGSFDSLLPRYFPEKKELRTKATVIHLSNDEYDQLVKNFRRRHSHR